VFFITFVSSIIAVLSTSIV